MIFMFIIIIIIIIKYLSIYNREARIGNYFNVNDKFSNFEIKLQKFMLRCPDFTVD